MDDWLKVLALTYGLPLLVYATGPRLALRRTVRELREQAAATVTA